MANTLFNISKKAVKSAEESSTFKLAVPETAEEKIASDGRIFKRWVETVQIVKAERADKTISNGSKCVQFYAQLKIRNLDSINKQKVVNAYQIVDFNALQNDTGENTTMNNMSIKVLKTLFDALEYELEDGEITIQLMDLCFPEKDSGQTSDLVNKEVCIQIVDGPRKDKPAERDQKVEEYMPA